jgi:Cd2+/Zn2+-exporting ATPase
MDLKPETAERAQSGEVVPVEALHVGDRVSVRPGSKVPIDGVIVQGATTLDESTLTGESLPVTKVVGDAVSAGTVVYSGFVEVECTARAHDSAVARLVHLVEEAQLQRSPTEKLVEQFAKYYTPLIVVVAVAMATVSWGFGVEKGQEWSYTALILLLVACPCSLVISRDQRFDRKLSTHLSCEN